MILCLFCFIIIFRYIVMFCNFLVFSLQNQFHFLKSMMPNNRKNIQEYTQRRKVSPWVRVSKVIPTKKICEFHCQQKCMKYMQFHFCFEIVRSCRRDKQYNPVECIYFSKLTSENLLPSPCCIIVVFVRRSHNRYALHCMIQ